jgi:hypothetical protein
MPSLPPNPASRQSTDLTISIKEEKSIVALKDLKGVCYVGGVEGTAEEGIQALHKRIGAHAKSFHGVVHYFFVEHLKQQETAVIEHFWETGLLTNLNKTSSFSQSAKGRVYVIVGGSFKEEAKDAAAV